MADPLKFSIDGLVLDPGDASLPLPDDGLLRGDGVFEVIRIYAGRPFALGLHLDRMERSAAAIELPLDRAALTTEIEALLDSLDHPDCLLRVVQTRAGRRIGSIEPLPVHTATIALATVTYSPTVILNGVKSLSYAANMQVTRLAKAAGAAEALFIRPDQVVLEAPTSSIFWATADGRLRTPAIEAGVLDSITRRKVLERIEVEQGEFPLDDLLAAPEAFLASTTREVQPIERIDDRTYPEKPGPLTKAAAAAFTQALEEELGA
ncbi:MAG: aminotransferase class IV family protein [Solirubrobacterales bacterium]|nr:aminotransferase class IV family protein [Solirubrobacterales bacterium]